MYEFEISNEFIIRFYDEDYYEILYFTDTISEDSEFQISLDCYDLIVIGA